MTAASHAAATTMPSHMREHHGLDNPFVAKLQGLVALSAPDIAALERLTAQPRAFSSHVDLIRDGQVPDTALIVLQGFACRYKQRQAGARQILSYLLPGDVCDDEGGDLGPLAHAVGTLSACIVAQVPRRELDGLLVQHPNIAHAWRFMRRIEIDTARAWLVNLGCQSATERMGHLFCELLTRMQAAGLVKGNTCPLPLTQAELGQTLGLSNVHVNRTLQELRRQGLVEVKGKSLRLLDLPRLRHLAEFSPAYLHVASRVRG